MTVFSSNLIIILYLAVLSFAGSRKTQKGISFYKKDSPPFQFLLRLLYQDILSTKVHPLCIATIIQKYWAVTSARCLTHVKVGEFMDLGYIVLRGNTSSFTCHDNTCIDHHVNYFRIHESYIGFGDLDYDIGLLNVLEPFNGRHEKPIRLAPKGYNYRRWTEAIVIAWPRRGGTEIKRFEVELRPFEQCKEVYKDEITREMVCAGSQRKDSCYSGWGAPLIQKRLQIGIASYEIECPKDHIPGLYTRVAKYIDWINKVIKEFNERFRDDEDTLLHN